jgi:HEAT repeat protein/cyclophilin family peptidyl-prolyl cis-trans isomerase
MSERVEQVVAVAGVVVLLAAAAGCRSAPVAPPPAVVTELPPSTDRKAGWILRLEQQRALRDANVDPVPTPVAAPVAPAPPAPRTASFRVAMRPDLEALALDLDPSIRRRAVQAIGRVGASSGVPVLVEALLDPEAEVRGAAAFGLGLLGQKSAVQPLLGLLEDTEPVARHRAIEALGLIGERCLGSPRACGSTAEEAPREQLATEFASVAGAIGRSVGDCAPHVSNIAPDDSEWPKAAEVESCRLAWFAVVRLRSYDGLAQLGVQADGRPVTTWWPLAYAFQRVNDPRAIPQLLSLASASGTYTASFALRGLATHKESRAVPLATAFATARDADVKLRIAAVRTLGTFGADGLAPLQALLNDDDDGPLNLRLEVITALGATGDRRAFPTLVDAFTDPRPTVRAATLAAAAKVDPDGFLVVLAGLGQDRDWRVRSALADVLAGLPGDRVTSALEDLFDDEDARVHGPALEALAAVGAPNLTERLYAALDRPDYIERATAARLIGGARPEGGIVRLMAAYERGLQDAGYAARAGAIEGLARYGDVEAKDAIRKALGDPAWPVRLRAADLLTELGESAVPERPAPIRQTNEFFESAALLHPPFSPHVFIETRAGTVEIELDVINAPVTSATFIELARSGFHAGLALHRVVPTFVVQDGDPRGDGAGGPGFTIADEINHLPYLRGAVGMALEWRDTGGSQWFVTLSPQPHLDAKYTVFGRVVDGWDVLDGLSQGDVIERVRIWDGVSFQ